MPPSTTSQDRSSRRDEDEDEDMPEDDDKNRLSVHIQVVHNGNVVYLSSDQTKLFALFSFKDQIYAPVTGNANFGPRYGTRPGYATEYEVVQAAGPTVDDSPVNVQTCNAPATIDDADEPPCEATTRALEDGVEVSAAERDGGARDDQAPVAEARLTESPGAREDDEQAQIARTETATRPSLEENTTTSSQPILAADDVEAHPPTPMCGKRRREEAQPTPRAKRVGNDRCSLCVSQGKDTCLHERARRRLTRARAGARDRPRYQVI